MGHHCLGRRGTLICSGNPATSPSPGSAAPRINSKGLVIISNGSVSIREMNLSAERPEPEVPYKQGTLMPSSYSTHLSHSASRLDSLLSFTVRTVIIIFISIISILYTIVIIVINVVCFRLVSILVLQTTFGRTNELRLPRKLMIWVINFVLRCRKRGGLHTLRGLLRRKLSALVLRLGRLLWLWTMTTLDLDMLLGAARVLTTMNASNREMSSMFFLIRIRAIQLVLPVKHSLSGSILDSQIQIRKSGICGRQLPQAGRRSLK
jgi:hypothetical protein